MIHKCTNCKKNIFLSKKYFQYRGKERGSLDITEEKIVCKDCNNKERKDEKLYEKAMMEVSVSFVSKKFKIALNILNTVFNPTIESDWYTKGNILVNLGQVKEAIKCYDEALFLDTHYLKAWYRKGTALISLKKYNDAAKCFENVVTLNPQNNERWTYPAIFSCMIAKVLYNNELLSKGKGSKEISLDVANWIDMAHQVLSKPIQINDKTVTFAKGQISTMEHINQFVDYCIANYQPILDALEPPIVVQFKTGNERH